MPSSLNPNRVKWKYFSLEEGRVVSSDEKPDGKEPVAILSTSTFACENKCDTPKLMKKSITRILQHDLQDGGVSRKPNICIAVPCDDFEVMEEYYGKENLKKHYGEDYEVEKDFITLRMYDDLAKGNEKFFPHIAKFEGTMPPKEGAEQLASAIENGFDIWSYAGGNSVTPKLYLCEEYFSQNYQSLKEQDKLQRKVKFVGFSNGTTMAFYLRGLVEYVLDFGIGWAFDSRDLLTKEKLDEELSDFRNSQTDKLLLSFEKRGDVEVKRKFNADADNFVQAKARYETALGEDSKITNLACYSGQMVPASVGELPKFGENEKIILGMESFHKKSIGFEPEKALLRFLESGAIDANNILFIVMEDFIDAREMLHIPRKNGMIPDYGELRPEEQLKIKEISKSDDVEVCQQYINESNLMSQRAITAITNVANEYGIPVVSGGERRVGHGKYCCLAPSYVSDLKFNNEDLSIEQVCLLKDNPEIEEDLILPRKHREREEAKLGVSKVKFDDLYREIENAKLIPLTGSMEFQGEGSEKVIVGRALDLCDLDAKDVEGKGLAVYLPMEPSLVSASEQFSVFQLSDNYKLAKFITLLTRLPDQYKKKDGTI